MSLLSQSSVILLPLRRVSLKHKNPERRKIFCGMHPIGCKDRLINLKVFYSCVISVAVVKWCLFLLVFVVLYNRRSIFLFQLTVIQSFGVCLWINCVVTKRSNGSGLGLMFFTRWVPRLIITICNKITKYLLNSCLVPILFYKICMHSHWFPYPISLWLSTPIC